MKVFSILCILAFKTPILIMTLLVVFPAQIMHGGCPSHGQCMSILSFPTIHCKLDLKLFHLVVHFAYEHQIYFYVWSFFIVSLGRWESFNFMFVMWFCIGTFQICTWALHKGFSSSKGDAIARDNPKDNFDRQTIWFVQSIC